MHSSLSGFLYVTELTQKLVAQNLKLTEPVEKALFKKFHKVRNDSVLGLVGRILEKEDFVAVLHDNGQCKSIITKLDFLTFVSKGKNDKTQNGHKNHTSQNGN